MANIILSKRWTMKPPVGTQINWGHPLAKDLKALWLFNEGAGLRATNVADPTNPAIINSGAVQPWGNVGSEGTVVNLGTGSGGNTIGASISTAYALNRNFTLHCRFYRINSGAIGGLISHSDGGYYLRVTDTNKINILQSFTVDILIGNATVTSNQWHSATATVDAGGAINLYLDGNLDATGSTSVTFSNTNELIIGADHHNLTEFFYGFISMPTIYGRVLSSAEVCQLHNDPYCFMQPQQPARRYFIPPPSLTAMLTRLAPRRWRMKPPVSTQLQYGNPLLIGLKECVFFNEGGGTPTNIATPTLLPSLVGTASWVSGLVGTGVHSNSATNQVRIADSSLNYATGDFTFRAVFTPVTWTSGFTDTFMKGNEFRLFFDASGNLSLAAMGGTDGGTCSTGMTAGGTYDFVITRSGSTCTCYVNGVNKGTFTNGNSTIQSAIFQYCGDGNRGSQGDINIYTHNFWTRALSPAEVEELYVNPYSLLRSAPRIKFGSTVASSGLITVTAVYSFLQEALLTASLIGKSEQEATGIVSRAWASAHEALALLSKTGLHQQEAMVLSKNIYLHVQEALKTATQQGLSFQEASGTVTRAVNHVQEALSKLTSNYIAQQESLLGLSKVNTEAQEALQGVSVARSSEQEAAGTVTRAVASAHEALAKLSVVYSSDQEALVSASKVYTAEQEALKGLQQAVASLQEASGTVKRIVTSEQEAFAYTKTVNISYQESLSSLSKVYSSVQEALKTTTLATGGFQEAKGIVTALLSSIQEAKAYVTSINTAQQESLKPVSAQLTTLQETLKGLSKTLLLSQEGLGGVKRTTTHTQEATAILVLSALLIEAASVVLTLLLEQTTATPTLEFEMTQEEV